MVDQGPDADAQCPTWAASLGYMGVAAAVCLSNWGSAVSFSLCFYPLSIINKSRRRGRDNGGDRMFAQYSDVFMEALISFRTNKKAVIN